MSRFLVLGQIGDPTTGLPGGAGAELWYLSLASYGQQVASIGADDSLLALDSDDVEFGGPGKRVSYRRLFIEAEYALGACVVRVTPRVDFQDLTPQTFAFVAPTHRTTVVLDVAFARVGTYLGFRVDVLSRAGPVRALKVSTAFRPVAVAAQVNA